MQFKTCQLIIETPNKIEDDMNTVVTLGNSKMIYNNEIYYIIKKIVKKKYLWLYCQYDNAKLYGDIVVDTKNEKEHKNTRKKTNIELRQQLFVVYDFDSHVLYLNNINKKNFVKKYIAEILQVEVTIKNIYASLIEFQNSIKALKKLKFTQYYNIMNAGKKNTIVKEFEMLWTDDVSYTYEEFSEVYRKEYKHKKQIDRLVREQQKIALQEEIIDYDACCKDIFWQEVKDIMEYYFTLCFGNNFNILSVTILG